MSRPRPLDLERLRHMPAQLLRTRDFDDLVASDLELRWWHQRAVHDAVGIVDGLEALRSAGGDEITVEPGLAYDCQGRELRLLERTTLAVPDPEPPRTLILRRRSDEDARVELRWLRRARLRPDDGVPLARQPEPARRAGPPYARREAAPRVVSGTTLPEGTAWEPWSLPYLGTIGVQVRVDTRPAGFTAIPCYFAALQWPQLPDTSVSATLLRELGMQYIQAEAVDSFRFCMVAADAETRRSKRRRDGSSSVAFARNQRLYVSWLGVEHGSGNE